MRYHPPPNWPQPPAGWEPPAGWQPDPAWGPAPPGWQIWVPDAPASPPSPAHRGAAPDDGFFSKVPMPLLVAVTAVIVVVLAVVVVLQFRAAAARRAVATSSTAVPVSSSAPASSSRPATSRPASPTTVPAPTATFPGGPIVTSGADIGQARTSNGLQMTLVSLQCGVPEVKSSYTSKKAVGQYCLVMMSAKNTGSSKYLRFSAAEMTVKGADEREYQPSVDAMSIYPGNEVVSEDLSSNAQVTGVFIFDLAAGDKPASLHYSGVIVDKDAAADPVNWQLP